jgi:hypothetical protein
MKGKEEIDFWRKRGFSERLMRILKHEKKILIYTFKYTYIQSTIFD